MALKPPRAPGFGWENRVSPVHLAFFQELSSCPAFTEATSFREQCKLIFERCRGVPHNQIAKFFDVDGNSVREQYKKLSQTPKPSGRPPILNEEQAASVLAFLRERANSPNPATVSDCLNFVKENFRIDMLPDTCRKWINRSTAFCTVEAEPMDQKRLEVSHDQIVSYFDNLREALTGVPAALVFNLDESGFQQFVDARDKVVIVEKGSQQHHFAVNRSERRATFLATVSADGQHVKPLIILPRATVEAELILAGYTEDQVVFAHSEKGFITTDIFTRYLTDVLVPVINYRRWELQYTGHAVLIMDSCTCHWSDTIRDIFDANKVRVVPLPPHSSDQLQPLDVGLFGNMKAAQSRVHVPTEMSLQSRQVIRILSGFHATFHPMAVTSAFRRAGISLQISSGRLFCCVSPSTCTALRNPAPFLCETGERRCVRFDKSRLEIQGGLWGRKADSLLTYAGLDTRTGEIADLDNVPGNLEPWDHPTHLSETIRELWNGELPTDDEEDDPDWECQTDDDSHVDAAHQGHTAQFNLAAPMPMYPQQFVFPLLHQYYSFPTNGLG